MDKQILKLKPCMSATLVELTCIKKITGECKFPGRLPLIRIRGKGQQGLLLMKG